MSDTRTPPRIDRPHRETAESVATALATDPERGLTAAEAHARLLLVGRNVLSAEGPVPWWVPIVAQFKDALVILLLVATAVSTAVWVIERETPVPYDAIAIFAIVLLNAVMGYIQQSRAASALDALRALSMPHANVVRDGERVTIEGAAVVPGDLILIEEGDAIPADARLVEAISLQTAEAPLTGESLAVSKDIAPVDENAVVGDRTNMVFSGTAATFGHGRAVVTATGMDTEMGHIAGLLGEVSDDVTPMQRELARLGKLLGIIVIVIAVAIVLTIILVEQVRGAAALFEVLILGVALAVAAVPEGLPALVTTVLALGVQRMAKRNAIVRHLAAVETLGSASVIASDKTGTLTRNEMTVRAVVTPSGRVDFGGTGYAPEGGLSVSGGAALAGDLQEELRRALTVAHQANNATVQREDVRWIVHGDPTEGALIVAARKAGLESNALALRFARVGEIPFSSERRLMSTVHTDREQTGRTLVLTKGAPGALVARCTRESHGAAIRVLTEERRAEILRTNGVLAAEALRTLAVASRELVQDTGASTAVDAGLEEELVFLGLIGMIDPPRPEAKASVERARGAGIRPIMITGDHPATALAIATELGIAEGRRVVTGVELEKQTDEHLDGTVRSVSVYARVSPEQKLRIVKALKRSGATVAMTGDGVNDAPALKTADIGIAMGITGTDVSKAAADVVLTDDNYATIIAAVEEGRAIFGNIRKCLRYLLSSNLGEVLTMFFGVLFARAIGLQLDGSAVALPLLATQILWVNLVTDGAPALALGLDPADAGLMRVPPRSSQERVITRAMWFGIVLVGVVMAVCTLGVLDASLPGGFLDGSGTMRHAQTMAFTTLVLCQLFNVFNARSDERSAFRGHHANYWLLFAIGISLALQVAVVYVPFLQNAFATQPLSGRDWLFCAAVASAVLWVRELGKVAVSASRAMQKPSRALA